MCPSDGRVRGQMEVLGAALLLGIVVMASLAIAGVAIGAFDGTQDQAEDQAIEQTMLDLRSAATDVGINGEDHRSLRVEPPGDAQVSLNEDAGRITIVHRNYTKAGGESELLFNESIGALEMTHGDTTYGFEGGGVFRKADGWSRLVAAPPFAYRGLTANLAVVKLEGEGSKSGPLSLGLSPGERLLPAYPDKDQFYNESGDRRYDNPIQNGTIEVTVQSSYYEGWHQFFQQRTTGSTSVNHDEESVTVVLESLTELDHDGNVIVSESEISVKGNPNIQDGTEDSVYLVDSNPIIDDEISTASECSSDADCTNVTSTDLNDHGPLKNGTYFVPGDVAINGDLDIDVSKGDVNVIIDGDLDLGSGYTIDVDGPEEYGVTYYIKGELRYDGDVTLSAPSAHQNVFVVGGQLDEGDTGGQNFEITGVIYAPNADFTSNGKFTLNGALYASSVNLGGGKGSTEIAYDPELDDHPLDLTGGPTPVMFLHITQNNVVINVS